MQTIIYLKICFLVANCHISAPPIFPNFGDLRTNEDPQNIVIAPTYLTDCGVAEFFSEAFVNDSDQTENIISEDDKPHDFYLMEENLGQNIISALCKAKKEKYVFKSFFNYSSIF